jgi:hypothetical protein
MLQSALYEQNITNALGKPFTLPTGADRFGVINMDLGRLPWQQDQDFHANPTLLSVINVFVSRMIFDVARDEHWYKQFEKLIQRKIATIHLPSFITTLELVHLDIGTIAPKITNIYEPIIDDWGIWIDFEVKYQGMVKLTIETHADMDKLGMHTEEKMNREEDRPVPDHIRPKHYWDEEVPESLETSPDEDFGSPTQNEDHGPKHKKFTKKIATVAKKIAHSKLVKDLTHFGPIQKVHEKLAENPIFMNVEITEFEGRMVIHVPPPPSDRIWWCFRTPPTTKSEAVPQMGSLSVPIVSDFVVKTIYSLLEHHLVWPNMEDINFEPMKGNKIFHVPLSA